VTDSTLRRPIWAGVLGCASVVEENGYPLGIDSFVSTLLRRAFVFVPLSSWHCWVLCDCGRMVGCRWRLSHWLWFYAFALTFVGLLSVYDLFAVWFDAPPSLSEDV
jgi:hypothetical protein